MHFIERSLAQPIILRLEKGEKGISLSSEYGVSKQRALSDSLQLRMKVARRRMRVEMSKLLPTLKLLNALKSVVNQCGSCSTYAASKNDGISDTSTLQKLEAN